MLAPGQRLHTADMRWWSGSTLQCMNKPCCLLHNLPLHLLAATAARSAGGSEHAQPHSPVTCCAGMASKAATPHATALSMPHPLGPELSCRLLPSGLLLSSTAAGSGAPVRQLAGHLLSCGPCRLRAALAPLLCCWHLVWYRCCPLQPAPSPIWSPRAPSTQGAAGSRLGHCCTLCLLCTCCCCSCGRCVL
jgi:hypothetical protein